MKVAVCGVTGTTGSRVARRLLSAGHSVRGLIRSGGAEIPALLSEVGGLETRQIDFEDPRSLRSALDGCDAAYLMVPATRSMVRWGTALHHAAEASGIRHAVRLSILGELIDRGVGLGVGVGLGLAHGQLDADLKQRDLAVTVLRPNGFMQNYLGLAGSIAGGSLYSSNGSGRAAIVDADDIARCAVAALEGEAIGCFDLTGPESLSNLDVAAHLSQELGWKVEAVTLPAAASVQAMLSAGLSPWLVDRLMEIQQATAEGLGARITPAVERLTGQAAGSFSEFVRASRTGFLAARTAT